MTHAPVPARAAAGGKGITDHRHAWVWLALPIAATRVGVLGEAAPDLAAWVVDAGLELAEDARAADVVLVDGPMGVDLAGLTRVGVVAIVFDGGVPLPRAIPRVIRIAEVVVATPLAAVRADVWRRRLVRALADGGMTTSSFPVGDRGRPPFQLRHGRRTWPLTAPGAVVIGSAGHSPETVLEHALRRSEKIVAEPLTVRWSIVAESGKVVAGLVGDRGRKLVLRVAGGAAARAQRTTAATVEALTAEAPANVADRLVQPLEVGSAGVATWSVEPMAAGVHPLTIGDALWSECIAFLAALHRTDDAEPQPNATIARLAHAAAIVSAHLDLAAAAALDRTVTDVAAAVTPLPVGWAHGDFWASNLLVQHGHLEAVIDWERARPDGLPLLDLLDLLAYPGLRAKAMGPGEALTSILGPLAAGPENRRIAEYQERTGLRLEREVLQSLVVAHWLDRLAHVLEEAPATKLTSAWLSVNVLSPLAGR